MRKFLFTCISALTVLTSLAQEMDLNVKNIPDSLLKNATVVTRYDKRVFEVTAPDRANHQVHTINTILNEVAAGELVFQHMGDKFRKLGDVEIKVYDASGKQINK